MPLHKIRYGINLAIVLLEPAEMFAHYQAAPSAMGSTIVAIPAAKRKVIATKIRRL